MSEVCHLCDRIAFARHKVEMLSYYQTMGHHEALMCEEHFKEWILWNAEKRGDLEAVKAILDGERE